jgi:hypothetical protein
MPKRLHRWKTLGACPSQLRPYSVREAKKMHDEPALMAEVQTTPLMMEGTTEIPPRTNAMTKGDWAAVPVEMEREGSLDLLY